MKHGIGVIAVVVGGALLAGGISYAAIPDSSGAIHSCYSQATGTWRPIDTETNPPQKCKSGESSLTWNQAGPQGPQGPPGVGPAYETSSTTHTDLPMRYTNILDLTLPAGDWYITGQVSLGNWSGQRVPVLCALFGDQTGQIGNISSAALTSYPGSGGDAMTVPLSYAAHLASADTVHLQCMSNAGLDATAFTEARQLTAVAVSSVTTQP